MSRSVRFRSAAPPCIFLSCFEVLYRQGPAWFRAALASCAHAHDLAFRIWQHTLRRSATADTFRIDIACIIDALQEINPEHGSDAFTLLAVLLDETNGDTTATFVLDPESLVGRQIIPHWEWKRYAHACDVLLKAGLTDTVHLPWTSNGFRASWNGALEPPQQKYGVLPEPHPLWPIKAAGLVFHGLRKSAVVMLLEVGCTTAEVQAITGQSMQMVEHYAKQVSQKKLAASAK